MKVKSDNDARPRHRCTIILKTSYRTIQEADIFFDFSDQ